MSKTIKELSAEVEGMKNSIKSIVNYFISNNPTVMPNIEVQTGVVSMDNGIDKAYIVGKEVEVYITVSFLKQSGND